MSAPVLYWVTAAREHHGWLMQSRRDRPSGGRPAAVQHRKALATLRTRRAVCMAQARVMRNAMDRARTDRQNEAARADRATTDRLGDPHAR